MDQHAEVRSLPLLAVLSSLGFTEWKSRKSDTEWSGSCPKCKPAKNRGNFSFDASGKFNCFSGCGLKGKGAIDIYQKLAQVGFKQAVEALGLLKPGLKKSPEVQQIDPPTSESAVKQKLENPPFAGKYDKFQVRPSPWLTARGLTQETLDRYEVFEYNNPARKSTYSGSVMLKIRRWSDGECIGYLSRNIGEVTPERPKYTFPKGLQKGLEVFGAVQLKEKAPVRVLYLVESPFAVMKFSQHGLPAVSTFGFSVSNEQVHTISQLAKGVIYLCDRNKRDQIAAYIESLSRVVWVKAPELPTGIEDPEQLSLSQILALT